MFYFSFVGFIAMQCLWDGESNIDQRVLCAGCCQRDFGVFYTIHQSQESIGNCFYPHKEMRTSDF